MGEQAAPWESRDVRIRGSGHGAGPVVFQGVSWTLNVPVDIGDGLVGTGWSLSAQPAGLLVRGSPFMSQSGETC